MIRFLRDFDRPSFWLGFLAATLFWWLFVKLRPMLARGWQALRAHLQAARQQVFASTGTHLRNDTLRLVQGLHLASPLFSLNEIAIPPRLLAPPAPTEPDVPAPPQDIVEQVLPYLPDWPEFPLFYGSPTLGLEDALSGGAHLAIVGPAGSGKSCALAYLVTQILERAPNYAAWHEHVPVWVHAAGLELPLAPDQDLLSPLREAITGYASPLTLPRLPAFLKTVFEQERALLLLDGLDELPPSGLQEAVRYLGSLLERFPHLRVVAAASPDGFGGLPALGFVPLSLAPWNESQHQQFLERWSSLWARFVAPANSTAEAIDPALIKGWLLHETYRLSPLELTLKVWAAYAGDQLGPRAEDAIEAYLRRMISLVQDPGKPESPARIRLALEVLAARMVVSLQTAVPRGELQSWLADFEPVPQAVEADPAGRENPGRAGKEAMLKPMRAGLFSKLASNSLLLERGRARLSLPHPVLAGYLAAPVIEQEQAEAELVEQPCWTGRDAALCYLAARQPDAAWVDQLLEDLPIDPLLSGLLKAARWLPAAPQTSAWRSKVMRQLVKYFQSEPLSLPLRARVAAALVYSGSRGVDLVFRQMLDAPHAELRRLTALASGWLRDTAAVRDLVGLMADRSPDVRRAACLALVGIGDQPALEAVATALLNGDEELRRFAAEALANHAEEGHPTLMEGSAQAELLVRRSVVFGLQRIRADWAVEKLRQIQVEDGQWVVKNAAGQALEELARANPRRPQPLPPLTETPWLIAYASLRGIGVAPGRPAYELLLSAVREGNEEQRQAAIEYLGRMGDESAVLPLYEVYFSCENGIQTSAFNALQQLRAAGAPLPPPVQFGYR